MAESHPIEQSIDKDSDSVPKHFCEPCHELNDETKPASGYCIDCYENLCLGCFNSHCVPKPLRHHQVVAEETKPKIKPKRRKQKTRNKPKISTESCHQHHGEMLQSYCSFHDQLCCKVCVKITHNSNCCSTEEISNLATNIHYPEELDNLNEKLKKLKNGFSKNANKTEDNNVLIEINHTNTMQHIETLQNEFDKLIAETKTQAERVREEDLTRIENVSETCEVMVEQIDKTLSNLAELKGSRDYEKQFIAMKHAESQLKSMDTICDTLDTNNTVSEYKIEAEDKVKVLLDELTLLVHIFFQGSRLFSISTTDLLKQIIKIPVFEAQSDVYCTIDYFAILSNKQVVIGNNKFHQVMLIDTNQNKILSELELSDHPMGITKTNADEIAVTIPNEHIIKILIINQNTLSLVKGIKVNGQCTGIVFNDRDQTLIVTYRYNPKIEIIDMAGKVIRRIEKDDKGEQLSTGYVALSPDMSGLYISDRGNKSVTLMTLSGEVKAVYTDKKLQSLGDLSVNKLGIVYVIDNTGYPGTVYQIDPDSGEFKLLLQNNCDNPRNLNYSDKEDKLYVSFDRTLKMYKMQRYSQ